MTPLARNRATTGPARAQPGARPARVRLSPTARERMVLAAFLELPLVAPTPTGAVTALLRRGLDLPHSTLGQILRRLERGGAIRLTRKRA